MSNKIYPIGIQNFEVLNSIDSESANPIPRDLSEWIPHHQGV